MATIRIVKKIESETLILPELKDFIGQEVEIQVHERMPRPRLTEADLAAYLAEVPPDDVIDPDLIERYREFDRQHNIGPDL